MNLKWIKLSCGAFGVVALLSILAACGSVQANGQYTPLDLHLSSAKTQNASNPVYSPYVLVVPASGTCHTGGMQVLPGTSYTAEANGQSYPVQLDNTTHTATFPTLPDNTWAVIQVPTNTDLNLYDCNGTIQVGANGQPVITGQMNIRANTIQVTQVHLLGNSHLHVDNGTINFVGSLDSNSTDLFDDNTGWISVQLPKSDSFHIDALTNAGNISTNLGTPTQSGSSSQLHVSSQSALGAVLTVNENSGSMNFNIV